MKRKSSRGRKQRAVQKRRRPLRLRRKIEAVPHTAKQYFARPRQFQDLWDRIAQVPGLMRSRGLSLKQASEELGLNRHVLLRLARSAFRKRSNGRYVAKSVDRLLRVLVIPTSKGLAEIAVRDSRQATRLGQYWAALQKYLSTGDASALLKFRGKRITDASRKRIPLLTDLEELDRLGSAGVLSFESLYSRVA